MRPTLALFLTLLLSACEHALTPPAPTSPAPIPSSAPARPTASPAPTQAPSPKLNNAAPPTRVSPIPSSIPPAAPPTSTPPISDTDLTNAIRQAISGDSNLSPAAQHIDITVSDGIVRLSGTLATERDKDNFRIAVARIPGIKSIDNRVLVRN